VSVTVKNGKISKTSFSGISVIAMKLANGELSSFSSSNENENENESLRRYANQQESDKE